MKTKLHFSLNSIKKYSPCKDGLNLLEDFLNRNSIQADAPVNILKILDSNQNIMDTLWGLRGVIEEDNLQQVCVDLMSRFRVRVQDYTKSMADDDLRTISFNVWSSSDFNISFHTEFVFVKYSVDPHLSATYIDSAANRLIRAATKINGYRGWLQEKYWLKKDLLNLIEDD